MAFDPRPDFAKRLEKSRIKRGFETAKQATDYFGWNYDSYIQHERGNRGISRIADTYAKAFRVSPAYLLTGEGGGMTTIVPIMGYLGAGAEILPEHEQVPPEGLDDVELTFAVPDEIMGLKIKGDSMLPRYRDSDVLLVWREQRRDTLSYIGEEAAVKTADGKRYVKNILRGPEPGTVTLDSWNARPIEGVFLDWVGEIYLMVPRTQLLRAERVERAASTRRTNRRAAETKGMDELPLARKG